MNRVVCNTYVGEHVEEEAILACKWLMKCLQKNMSAKEVEELEDKYFDGDEEEVPKDIIEWWEVLQWEELMPAEFYKKAKEGGADRFIFFNNNSYIDIVAIQGLPKAKDIGDAVLGAENNVDSDTEEIKWMLGEIYCEELMKEYGNI